MVQQKINPNTLELQERLVKINRVSKTVKGGRIQRFTAIMVVGGEYGAGRVLLKPASEGTGVIAGGYVRAVIDMVGIKDIRAKCLRSNNPGNVVKATFEGLKSLRTIEEVADMRGKEVSQIKK